VKRRVLNAILLFGAIAGFACLLVYALVLWYYHYISVMNQPVQYVIFYEDCIPIRVTEIIILTSALIPAGIIVATYIKKVIKGK